MLRKVVGIYIYTCPLDSNQSNRCMLFCIYVHHHCHVIRITAGETCFASRWQVDMDPRNLGMMDRQAGVFWVSDLVNVGLDGNSLPFKVAF